MPVGIKTRRVPSWRSVRRRTSNGTGVGSASSGGTGRKPTTRTTPSRGRDPGRSCARPRPAGHGCRGRAADWAGPGNPERSTTRDGQRPQTARPGSPIGPGEPSLLARSAPGAAGVPSGSARRFRRPFFGDARGIERGAAPVNLPGIAEVIQQRAVKGVPHAGFLPVPQTPQAGHPRASPHLRRQHLPGNAGLQHEDAAGQRGTVGHMRAAVLGVGRFGRQQQGDDVPQIVVDGGTCSRIKSAVPLPGLNRSS